MAESLLLAMATVMVFTAAGTLVVLTADILRKRAERRRRRRAWLEFDAQLRRARRDWRRR